MSVPSSSSNDPVSFFVDDQFAEKLDGTDLGQTEAVVKVLTDEPKLESVDKRSSSFFHRKILIAFSILAIISIFLFIIFAVVTIHKYWSKGHQSSLDPFANRDGTLNLYSTRAYGKDSSNPFNIVANLIPSKATMSSLLSNLGITDGK